MTPADLTPAPYGLAPGVHVCASAGSAVFLDLRKDEYLALPNGAACALNGLVSGWQSALNLRNNADDAAEATPDEARGVAEKLVEMRLLATRHDAGRTVAAPELDVSRVSHPDESERPLQLRATDVIRFMVACAVTLFSLRFTSLERAVDRQRSRKLQLGSSAAASDLDRAVQLTRIFRQLRPFVFTAKNQCLFHAIALMEFLSRYGIAGTWVIGVQTRPWAAHTWVQLNDVVLDGSPEIVRFYSPILVV